MKDTTEIAEKRYLVKFDFGLYYAFGEAVEILTETEMKKVRDFCSAKTRVYLGEIEGKHSEVYGPLSYDDWRIISEDQREIEVFEKLLGVNFGAFCMTELIDEALDNLDE